MTERQVTEPVPWWRHAAIGEDLEQGLKLLQARENAGTSEGRAHRLSASLDVLVRAARRTGIGVNGRPEEVEAFLAAEHRLNEIPAGSADPSTSRVEVLECTLDALLAFPSRKLAVYGSLAPGEVNDHVLDSIRGSWQDGFVRGHVANVGWGADYGFPALTWDSAGAPIPVKLLVAPGLPSHWERIDRFEGDGYQRILIPVEDGGGVVAVANIYAVKTD